MTEPVYSGTHYTPYPPPPEPEKPRRSRRRWITGAAIVVVAIGVTVALIVALTGGNSNSSTDRYGQKAADVVHDQHIICDNPQMIGDGIASCKLPGGVSALVATADNEAEMGKLVAAAVGCTVVVKGYLVNAPTTNALTVALSAIPKEFANKHHGYLTGDCN